MSYNIPFPCAHDLHERILTTLPRHCHDIPELRRAEYTPSTYLHSHKHITRGGENRKSGFLSRFLSAVGRLSSSVPRRRAVQRPSAGPCGADVLNPPRQPRCVPPIQPPQETKDFENRFRTTRWPAGGVSGCAGDCETRAVSSMFLSSARTGYSALREFYLQEMYPGTTSSPEHIISCNAESVTRLHLSISNMWRRSCGGGLQRGCGTEQGHVYG